MPKSVPLRHMTVTIVLPSTLWPASAIVLQAAMTGLSTASGLSPMAFKMSEAISAPGAVFTM